MPVAGSPWWSPAVFLLAVLPFLPALGGDFLTWDDDVYVTANARVRDGLTAGGLAWALRSFETGNWHPLTWASLMLDAEIHGLSPGGFHRTNLLFHGANAVLVFVLLARVAGSRPVAAAGAIAWAVHPLRVESVAWISERKDVLSAFFGLLAVHAWLGSVPSDVARPGRPLDHDSRPGLLATTVLLALSIACKPMLVTLPVLLLLLDAWPLGRLARPGALSRSIVEKWPLWILSAAGAGLAIAAQQGAGAVARLDRLPLGERLANAAIAPLRYLRLTAWPTGLAAVVPFPESGWGLPIGVAAATALLGISAACWSVRRGLPSIGVGWAWFLVALLPVAGIVQVGVQSIADRYTYLPSVGLVLGLAGAFAATVPEGGERRAASLLAAAACAVLAGLAFRQSFAWRDTVTLMERTLAETGRNPFARASLALALMDRGDDRRAIELYEQVLAERPGLAQVHVNLGILEARNGGPERAAAHYRAAIALEPGSLEAWNDLGAVLLERGDATAAAEAFANATRIDPGRADAWFNLGAAELSRGAVPAALDAFRRAASLSPTDADARHQAGVALAALGRRDEAIAAWRDALRVAPDHAEAAAALRDPAGAVARVPGDVPPPPASP
jgi:tetratricopeptide (TPR) repeat protein